MKLNRFVWIALAVFLALAIGGPAFAQGGKIIIGYDAFSAGVSFSKRISDNIKADCDRMGYTLIQAESKGDASAAMKNVDAFLLQGANYIIECSWSVAAVEAVAKRCKAAGVPCISIDIPVADAYFFGVNNTEAGMTTGNAAVAAIKKNWGGKLDFLVLGYQANAGEEVKKRCSGIADAIKAAGIPLADSQIIWMDTGGSEGTLKCKSMGTDFLTAHPNSKRILFGCVNDQAGQGFWSAAETSGRTNDVLVVSQGADEPALANLRKPANNWLGSTAYLPEQYGDYILKMIADLAAGKPVPQQVFMKTQFLDKSNVEKFYPNN
jgi:ribose transport system substrate-binding protein